MKHADTRDLVGGLALAALGTFVALYAASHYTVGEPARMGPGFFPVALGWILAALGAVIALLSIRRSVKPPEKHPIHWRSLVAILAAILVFGQTVQRLGLVPAAVALTLLAALAERRFKLRRALLLGAGLALISWLIFTVGLQMTLPAFTLWG